MSKCIYEYKYDEDDKKKFDDIRHLEISKLTEIKNKLNYQKNAIKAVNSVILLKECVILYDECLKNIDDGNTNDYNTNRIELEKKIQPFKTNQFIHHKDFRLGVLHEIYPQYDEDKLIEKAQVFQTGDIIPFEKLPHKFTELLSRCPRNSRKRQKIQTTDAKGKTKKRKRRKKGPKKNKLETKKKIDFKKLRKHITQRLKPRSKFKFSKTSKKKN